MTEIICIRKQELEGMEKKLLFHSGKFFEYENDLQKHADTVNAGYNLALSDITSKGRVITIKEIRGALARGYCSKENENKVLDIKLVQEQVKEIMNLIKGEGNEYPTNKPKD